MNKILLSLMFLMLTMFLPFSSPASAQRQGAIVGKNGAIAVDAEAGGGAKRADISLGHTLGEKGRVKATVGRLCQSYSFAYASGPVDENICQNEAGIFYQHTGPIAALPNLEVGAWYADASGKEIGAVEYFFYTPRAFTLAENARRAAGSVSRGASAGSRWLWKKGSVGITLHYDEVDFGTVFSGQSKDLSGFGGTLAVSRSFGKKLNASALVSSRAMYDEKGAQLTWRLNQRGYVGLKYTDIDGKGFLADSGRLSAFFGYVWGGSARGGRESNSLASWTAERPVALPNAVLAVSDGRSRDIVRVLLDGLPAKTRIDNTTGNIVVGGMEPFSGSPFMQVTKDGKVVSERPFAINGQGELTIATRNLLPPGTYVVQMREADGDKTIVRVVTDRGSVVVTKVEVEKNISPPPPPAPPAPPEEPAPPPAPPPPPPPAPCPPACGPPPGGPL